jgi:hypothetical protein
MVQKLVNYTELIDARLTIVEKEVTVLREANAHYGRKNKRSKARLQITGCLEVEEAQNLITQKERGKNTPKTTRKRASPTCSKCRIIGHTIRTCKATETIVIS